MSNLLFTPASLSQQETALGGVLQQETAFGGVKNLIVVNVPVFVNLNLAAVTVIGSKNVVTIGQGITTNYSLS